MTDIGDDPSTDKSKSGQSVTSFRLNALANGWTPIPALGKIPGLKGWQNGHDPTEADIHRWADDLKLHVNTGCLTRLTPCLDLDLYAEGCIEAMEQHVKELYEPVLVRIGNPPKRCFPFRTETPFGKIQTLLVPPGLTQAEVRKDKKLAAKIEFLCDGQQFIVDGKHPQTKQAYRWHNGSPANVLHLELPEINEAEARELVEALVKIAVDDGYEVLQEGPRQSSGNGQTSWQESEWEPRTDWDELRSGDPLDHDLLTAMAAKFVSHKLPPRETYYLLHAWVMSAETGSPERAAKQQRRLGELGDIVRSARDKFARDSVPPTDTLPLSAPDGVFDLDDNDFIEGVLAEDSLAVVYGDSGVGKTFWVIDLGLHAAAGADWNERQCDQSGVIYIAMEGGRSIKNRVNAAIRELGLKGDIPFRWATMPVDMRSNPADAQRVVNTVKDLAKTMPPGVRVLLIIIDTLSAALNGGKEDAEDLGKLLANARLIKSETGACVLFVAHCGKDQARGIRGWSGVRAAIDTEIELTRVENSHTARLSKERDGPDNAGFGFTLKPVELGIGRRDKPVTTCVIEHAGNVEPPPARETKLKPDHIALRSLIAEIVNDHGRIMTPLAGMSGCFGMDRKVLRQYLIERGWFSEGHCREGGKLSDSGYTAERNSFRVLERHKFLGFTRDLVWLIRK